MIVMLAAKLGDRPRTNPTYSYRHQGFTTIELMMSVILLAVSTALAIPSYRDMVEKRQLTNAAEQLAAFVDASQGVASRSNQVVTVSFEHSGHDDWCIGATLGTGGCDCGETNTEDSDYCSIDSQSWVMTDSFYDGEDLMHQITGNDGDISFDPVRGMFVDTADFLTMEMHSESRDYKLDLMVNASGRVVLCSHDASHAVPGYDVCPSEEEV
jgi:type IV fimbrial biogenesis protein FimT